MIWKPVIGYDGLYEVSSTGIVKRIAPARKHKGNVIISPHVTHNGYFRVSLSKKAKPKKYFVHRLVYQAFTGDIPSDMEINHKNGDKQDNRIENLELVTSKENKRHAFEVLGIKNMGEKHGMAKLKNQDIPVIRKLLDDGVLRTEIAKRFNVSKDTISLIKANKIWKNF